MKKNVLLFGLVLGIILCVNMIIMVNMMYSNPEFKSNDLLGYAVMVVIFSLIFFGIRNYRNKELGGIISFGKAFKTGLLIALVASTLYVVVWLFYYYLFVPDFIDKYTAHVLRQCTSETELASKTEEMENFKEMYKNPLFIILITYAEVLPVGLIVALVSSFILKKKNERTVAKASEKVG
jgi:amino acid transporter